MRRVGVARSRPSQARRVRCRRRLDDLTGPISSQSACSSPSKRCSAPTTRSSWPSSCSACRASQQKKALRYGLIGGFAFRIVATLLAVYLIRIVWVKLLGGLYLLYLTYSPLLAAMARRRERRAAQKAKPMFGLSALWATVVRVELVNLVFSIDSILVAVAMSPKTWVVITGGILGIVAMRLVAAQLIALVERYPALVDGAFVIIAWVGIKLALEYLHAVGYIALRDPEVGVARA